MRFRCFFQNQLQRLQPFRNHILLIAMIHICKLITANPKAVLYILKCLTDTLITQLQRLVSLFMSKIVIDHFQIIQIKQNHTCCAQFNITFLQIFHHVLVSVSVHGLCEHIHVGYFLQIDHLLFLDVLIIILGNLNPDQHNDKQQGSCGKQNGCLLEFSQIIKKHFRHSEYYECAHRILEFLSFIVAFFSCFVKNEHTYVNRIGNHNNMGYRKHPEYINNSCTLKQNITCHIHKIKSGKNQCTFVISAFTDII